MEWLKLSALKVGDRGFEPHSGLQFTKKQSVSSPRTRKNSILLGASVNERLRLPGRARTARARISNPIGGQCHLIHLTILERLSWPSLAYYVHRGGLKPYLFNFISCSRSLNCYS